MVVLLSLKRCPEAVGLLDRDIIEVVQQNRSLRLVRYIFRVVSPCYSRVVVSCFALAFVFLLQMPCSRMRDGHGETKNKKEESFPCTFPVHPYEKLSLCFRAKPKLYL